MLYTQLKKKILINQETIRDHTSKAHNMMVIMNSITLILTVKTIIMTTINAVMAKNEPRLNQDKLHVNNNLSQYVDINFNSKGPKCHNHDDYNSNQNNRNISSRNNANEQNLNFLKQTHYKQTLISCEIQSITLKINHFYSTTITLHSCIHYQFQKKSSPNAINVVKPLQKCIASYLTSKLQSFQ